MKRKYLYIGGCVLAIVLITFSVFQWNSKVETTVEKSKEDLKVAETKKKTTSENGESPENAEGLADEGTTSNPNSNPAKGNNHSTTHSNTESGNGQSQTDGTSDTEGNTESPRFKGTSLEQIKAAYRTIFSDLEVQETSRADQLMVQAKADYVSGKMTKSDLVVKYQDAATALEQNADKIFNTIYNQLLDDLEKYGHNPSEAVEFKDEYEAKKQQRLARIFSELEAF
ncbi:hypothetical protein [Niallia endozanthoxylica]|uniref:Uncharacterized protein n=1 Tax=Niallia endozanthoxylica TaxID=2036016 RepID=A0A5J5H3D1_9BACI|nr:hypothetical protein [Niallia endozanthoxylica]KAA9014192.1 hypothetical protein F4V44_24055 [Niallia endozanthoxylica]